MGVVLLLYLLSFGPAVWLAERGLMNSDVIGRLHLPLLRMYFILPEWCRGAAAVVRGNRNAGSERSSRPGSG